MLSYRLLTSITEFEAVNNTTPIGTNTIPRIKNVIITGLGVKIGCHALSCCCLNAVSKIRSVFYKNKFTKYLISEGERKIVFALNPSFKRNRNLLAGLRDCLSSVEDIIIDESLKNHFG